MLRSKRCSLISNKKGSPIIKKYDFIIDTGRSTMNTCSDGRDGDTGGPNQRVLFFLKSLLRFSHYLHRPFFVSRFNSKQKMSVSPAENPGITGGIKV
jgi:hypothetical protein